MLIFSATQNDHLVSKKKNITYTRTIQQQWRSHKHGHCNSRASALPVVN